MTEGPWTVAANPRAPKSDMQAAYKDLARAIHGVGAAMRMSKTECVRADVWRVSLEASMIAWQNVNDILEEATMAAEGALATLLEVTLQASTVTQTREDDT